METASWLPHSLTAFRLVRENRLHRGLRALGLLLPAALLLIVILLVPQRVLVCRKHARERGTVVRIQPRAAKVAIDRLSRQDRQLVPQFTVDILPPNRHLFRLQAAVIERIQHTLDRNIARKIPQLRPRVRVSFRDGAADSGTACADRRG